MCVLLSIKKVFLAEVLTRAEYQSEALFCTNPDTYTYPETAADCHIACMHMQCCPAVDMIQANIVSVIQYAIAIRAQTKLLPAV